jgi:hypothetical protein
MSKENIYILEITENQMLKMLAAVNAIKDFNRATDEKLDISYDVVQRLDYADDMLAFHLGFEQPMNEAGHKCRWADFSIRDDVTKTSRKNRQKADK